MAGRGADISGGTKDTDSVVYQPSEGLFSRTGLFWLLSACMLMIFIYGANVTPVAGLPLHVAGSVFWWLLIM